MGLFSRLIDAPAYGRVKSILIVEDEALIAFDNEHALELAGYSVAGVVDRFSAAIKAMASRQIDLIVADIDLRGRGSGLDVARHAGARGVPVLFSAAICPPEAHLLGVGWLAKPHMPRDLIRAIHAVDLMLAGLPVRERAPGLTLFDPQH